MYIGLMGTCQQGSGPPALSIENLELGLGGQKRFQFEAVIGEDFPITSSAGEIHWTTVVSGGDGNYTYAWTVTETDGDDEDISAGNITLSDAGTQTGSGQPVYNDAIITVTDAGRADGDEVTVFYHFSVTVTDGTGATVQTSTAFRITVIYLE